MPQKGKGVDESHENDKDPRIVQSLFVPSVCYHEDITQGETCIVATAAGAKSTKSRVPGAYPILATRGRPGLTVGDEKGPQ